MRRELARVRPGAQNSEDMLEFLRNGPGGAYGGLGYNDPAPIDSA